MEMVPYVAAQDLSESEQIQALKLALNTALDRECTTIVLGVRIDNGKPVVCTCGCMWGSAGALILIPDVLVLESMANGAYASDDAMVKRADGRSAVILKMLPESRPPS